MNELGKQRFDALNPTFLSGSYLKEDCVFLLKDISSDITEEGNEEREDRMDNGVHYSEMLPIEAYPSADYLNIFHHALADTAHEMAQYVADVAEMIVKKKGKQVVLVSLARAGTPVGVLIKRYLTYRYGLDVPHYSVSIIRGKGLDENALLYIAGTHPGAAVQFIDGWTGKGTINKVLAESVSAFNAMYDVSIHFDLAVLADPAHAAPIYGTRKDYFLPSSCLNSIVSGLVSRTVHRADLIAENEFHGAKIYDKWVAVDLTRYFVKKVTDRFVDVELRFIEPESATGKGWDEVERIQHEYGISTINKVKPGIGETTRVLLRRVPWKIIVKDRTLPELKHIILLAQEKQVPIELDSNLSYGCIGIIR